MKIRIIAAILTILAGLTIVLYPWVKAWYFNCLSYRAMRLWQERIALSGSSTPPNPPGLPAYNIGQLLIAEDTDPIYDMDYVVNNMEGIINIDAINLHSPIFYVETKKNLDLGICRLYGSVNAGENGNYILAGHKSRIYGRHFNRLKEMSIGDKVTIQTPWQIYTYAVTDHFAVTADEDWVLNDDFNKIQITLITCDYDMHPIGRYVVRGELVE